MEDLVGRQLGQYKIEAKIGQGAMAAVYKAFQPSLERYVAIKVMPPFLAKENPVFITRFQREARSIARLQHPNILPVYDFGVDGEYSYIVMRYVAGVQTLRQMVSRPLDQAPNLDTILQVAAALNYAHKNGVVHRDIKPSNILLDEGWALLSDFGVAKAIEFGTRVTGTGKSVGTPAYMSPEQAKGKSIDHRTDIYALGLILYEMLTHALPHDAETPLAILLKRTTEVPSLPRSLNAAIPPQIERVIMRSLALNPDDRFGTAEQFSLALKSAIAAQPYQPPSTGAGIPRATEKLLTAQVSTDADDIKPATQVGEPQSRHPNFIWIAGVWGSIILMVLLLWGSNVFYTTASQPLPEPTSEVLAVASIVTETATPSPSPTITNTPIPPTGTPTETPAPTFTPSPVPPTPSPLMVVVTATASPTPSPSPSPTPRPPTATPTVFVTATPNLAAGTFTLLAPYLLDEPTYGLTTFEWIWPAVVPPDYGFEVRVWRENEPVAGAHDAVLDNQQSRIEQLNEQHYRLTLDITQAAGVRERRGEYLWSVALVQINPAYADLGLQAEAGRLRFEVPGSGGSSSSGGNGGSSGSNSDSGGID